MTLTGDPLVPDSRTSRFAIAKSGATHVPAGLGFSV